MSNTYQYNKGKSYHSWWSSREDTDSETLVKGYSTLIPIKYNNSDPRNKGSHNTQISHPSNYIMKVTQGAKKVLMENSHKPSMMNPINNPQLTTYAYRSKISSTNISLRPFFVMNAHTLVINKSYYNEKLQRMNKLSQITSEHMKPHPMRQPPKLKPLNQCQMMECMEWYDYPICINMWRIIIPSEWNTKWSNQW